MSRYSRSAGDRISGCPAFAAATTAALSAAAVLSWPQYWSTAPGAGRAAASWCQATTVLPYRPTTAWARSMKAA